MRITRILVTLTAAALFVFLGTAVLANDFVNNWHNWRGPNFDGSSPNGDPPIEWSETKNIKWKVEIPGEGASTPIIWGDRIVVLSAVKTDRKPGDKAVDAQDGGDSSTDESGGEQDEPREDGGESPDPGPGLRGGPMPDPEPAPQERRGGRRGRRRPEPPTTIYEFTVHCLNKNDGSTIWKRIANEEVPHEGKHSTSTFAPSSPMTDGELLYCSFGSRGTYCYDWDGNLIWEVDLGDQRTSNTFGEGSSPVVYGDSLVHLWDHEDDSFIVCLDAKTGKERWRVARDEKTTWNTPLIIEHEGVTHVIANGSNRTRSYDLKTGKVIWECGGQVTNPIPSPMVLDGVVYCMSGYRGNAIFAIPLSARGDITDSDKIVWSRTDAAPYIASPLLYDGLIYLTKSRSGILSCLDAKTGEPHYAEVRLPETDMLYASLVGAANRVYIAARNGRVLVLEHGKEYKLLASNLLSEGIDASPVVVGNELFLRGTNHLYCIAETKKKAL